MKIGMTRQRYFQFVKFVFDYVNDELLLFARSRREEMVMADMQIRPGKAWEYCPRNALRKVTSVLLNEFNVVRYESILSTFEFSKTV
jgi:hypothetical protein